jgi:uncharacterized protein DUF4189
MRRLYIQLASVVIATLLIAVASSAGASAAPEQPSPKQPIRYTALAVAPSLIGAQYGNGYTGREVKRNALYYRRCYAQDHPEYTGDCQGAVWVHNGFVAAAYEATQEQPYSNLAWGSGWGDSQQAARSHALRVCQRHAQASCVAYGGGAYRTPDFDPSLPTRGSPW